MRVCVVAEYYPRRRDPVLGAWAHRQAIAARDAGADVRVLVLERPLPSTAAARAIHRDPGGAARDVRGKVTQPRRDVLDGIEVQYVRFVSPRRERAYGSWHKWAAWPLRRALDRLNSDWRIELVHAHYALPAGGAALGWTRWHAVPLVVSVHGGDLLSPLLATSEARSDVGEVLRSSAVVIGNSARMLDRAAELAWFGSTPEQDHMRVIHPPGTPPPAEPPPRRPEPTVATLAHVDPRKRHVDVLEALRHVRDRVPGIRYAVIGDGPERGALERRARQLGVGDRVEWLGALPPHEAIAELARCHLMAMPSEDEAFGIAYTEALSVGVPAIGCEGGPGPEEIAELVGSSAPGSAALTLVPPREPRALADAIAAVLGDRAGWARRSDAARAAAAEHFSLSRCGELTVAAYRDALEWSAP
jgi:glycosyltransferase involved in cell wall biosynthesis